jgi:hypothetical protein
VDEKETKVKVVPVAEETVADVVEETPKAATKKRATTKKTK